MKKLVGIYLDGSEFKIAVFVKKDRQLYLVDVITYNQSRYIPQDEADNKGFEQEKKSDEIDKIIVDDSSSVIFDKKEEETTVHQPTLFDILTRYRIREMTFLPAASEPNISYHFFNEPKKMDKKTYKKRLIEEWKNYQKATPDIEKIRFIQYPDNSVISVYENEYLPILSHLEALGEQARISNLSIPQVIPADLAIFDYIKANYSFENEKTYLIAHIGTESTRLVFVQDKKIKHISGYLSFGSQTSGIENILVRKIVLETENAQVLKIDKVYLSGDLSNPEIVNEFQNTIEFSEVEVISFNILNLTYLAEEKRENLTNFAIPITSVYNFIATGKKSDNKINLLPKDIAEKQKLFKIGFTGAILLVLIFILVAFFTYKFMGNKQKLNTHEAQLKNLENLIQENIPINDSIAYFSGKIEASNKIKENLDSLVIGAERSIDLLDRIEQFELRKKRFWLTTIAASGSNNFIQGLSLNKNSITQFSDYMDYSLLKNILTSEVRKKNISKFEMTIDPAKYGLKGLEDEPQN